MSMTPQDNSRAFPLPQQQQQPQRHVFQAQPNLPAPPLSQQQQQRVAYPRSTQGGMRPGVGKHKSPYTTPYAPSNIQVGGLPPRTNSLQNGSVVSAEQQIAQGVLSNPSSGSGSNTPQRRPPPLGTAIHMPAHGTPQQQPMSLQNTPMNINHAMNPSPSSMSQAQRQPQNASPALQHLGAQRPTSSPVNTIMIPRPQEPSPHEQDMSMIDPQLAIDQQLNDPNASMLPNQQLQGQQTQGQHLQSQAIQGQQIQQIQGGQQMQSQPIQIPQVQGQPIQGEQAEGQPMQPQQVQGQGQHIQEQQMQPPQQSPTEPVSPEDMLTPPPGGNFPTFDALFQFAQTHALSHGYAFVIGRSKRDNRGLKKVFLICDRGGTNKEKVPGEARQRKTKSRKCGCEFGVFGLETKTAWILRGRIDGEHLAHNHPPSESPTEHPGARKLDPKAIAAVKALEENGVSVKETLEILHRENPTVRYLPRDIYNARAAIKRDPSRVEATAMEELPTFYKKPPMTFEEKLRAELRTEVANAQAEVEKVKEEWAKEVEELMEKLRQKEKMISKFEMFIDICNERVMVQRERLSDVDGGPSGESSTG